MSAQGAIHASLREHTEMVGRNRSRENPVTNILVKGRLKQRQKLPFSVSNLPLPSIVV
jgi:hypothetical protein